MNCDKSHYNFLIKIAERQVLAILDSIPNGFYLGEGYKSSPSCFVKIFSTCFASAQYHRLYLFGIFGLSEAYSHFLNRKFRHCESALCSALSLRGFVRRLRNWWDGNWKSQRPKRKARKPGKMTRVGYPCLLFESPADKSIFWPPPLRLPGVGHQLEFLAMRNFLRGRRIHRFDLPADSSSVLLSMADGRDWNHPQ